MSACVISGMFAICCAVVRQASMLCTISSDTVSAHFRIRTSAPAASAASFAHIAILRFVPYVL
jgi:hypothetical protein